jgi:hypothetical protein
MNEFMSGHSTALLMETSPECQGQIGCSEAAFLAKNPGLIFRKLIMNNLMETFFFFFWADTILLFSPNILS